MGLRLRGAGRCSSGDARGADQAAVVAETRSAFRLISAREFRLLLAAGAPDVAEVRVIRSRGHELGAGFAAWCDGCAWFIRGGVQPREGTCCCGQRYRVVFDRGDTWAVIVRWRRCAGCGVLFQDAHEGRQLNEWRRCCEACANEPRGRGG
jgi:hypothetical protein